MVILLFGPPGCGKGTQAVHLAERYGIPSISTGEMFRAECQAGTELGRKASAILASGGLVGDDIVNEMVARRISREDCTWGFLLDGYPRTVPQARYFSRLLAERGLPSPLVIHLDVPAEALLMRLTARRQCPQCHRIYNLLLQPPTRPGICDQDGASLVAREDDQESVIRQRLREYEAQSGPVLDWYGRPLVYRIDANQKPERVTEAIEGILDGQILPKPAARPVRPQRFASALRH